MIRTQIQLTQVQSERLRVVARRTGVSMAEVIRLSIDRFLEDDAVATAPCGRSAALEVIGRFHSGLADVAERHDDYLDEAYRPYSSP